MRCSNLGLPSIFLILCTLIGNLYSITAWAGSESSAGGGNSHRISGQLIRYSQRFYGFGLDVVPNHRRQKIIKNFIEHELKSELIREIDSWSKTKILVITSRLPQSSQQKIRDLLIYRKDKIFQDIHLSSYIASDQEIFVDADNKDARTNHDFAAPVLFNPKRLSQIVLISDNNEFIWGSSARLEKSKIKELLKSLFFHEHMRHFGFKDEDYRIGTVMTIAQSATLSAVFQYKGEEFWKKLNLTIGAKALAHLSSHKLLCPSPLGEVACEGIEKIPAAQLLDLYSKKVTLVRKNYAPPRGSGFFMSDIWRATIIGSVNREAYEAGIRLNTERFNTFLGVAIKHDPTHGLSFGEYCNYFNPNSAHHIVWHQ